MDIWIIIGIIVIISVLVIYIANRLFSKKRYVKYIPIMLATVFAIYNFIAMVNAPYEGFEALGRFVMELLLLAAIIPALALAVILDILHKKNNKDEDRIEDRID